MAETSSRKRIAIIGSGISGLTAAYYLNDRHEVTVFESDSRIGGHTHTVDVPNGNGTIAVDTGFIVFNDRTYPNFIALMNELKVASQPTTMSFSVKCEGTGLEYRGADLGGIFAQRKNLLSPRFYRLLYDIVRFNRLGNRLLSREADGGQQTSPETVGSFLKRHRFSEIFTRQYFLPMGAAIWSASFETFADFPIDFICEFYRNHGLLGLTDRPQWRVICGGSKNYLEPLTRSFADRIHTNCRVTSVVRRFFHGEASVELNIEQPESNAARCSQQQQFDHVIFACHSDQALAILGDNAKPVEQEILSAFPYQKNEAILHTQNDVLPNNRRAWAAWNYFNPVDQRGAATVTYNMNLLQSLDCDTTWCVTLNDSDRIQESNIHGRWEYHHPTFDLRRKSMQRRHGEIVNRNGTSFCGAYWGNGFHEDGVRSAMAVVEAIDANLRIDRQER